MVLCILRLYVLLLFWSVSLGLKILCSAFRDSVLSTRYCIPLDTLLCGGQAKDGQLGGEAGTFKVFLLVGVVEAFFTEFLFPPGEDEGEDNSYGPVGDSVGYVGLGTPVVEGGEDVCFCEHIHDFYGEDEGKEFDGF